MPKNINKKKIHEDDKIKDYDYPENENAEQISELEQTMSEEDKIKDYEHPAPTAVNEDLVASSDTEETIIDDDDDDNDDIIKNSLPAVERKVNTSGKLIMVLNDYTSDIELSDISMETNDALYINLTDTVKVRQLIKMIRTSEFRSVYLMPVFLCALPDDPQPVITDLIDGIYTNINEEMLNIRTASITSNIHILKELKEDKYEKKVLYKMLRYMYTRDYILEPYINPYSTQGYFYPFIDIHYKGELFKDKLEYKILEDGEKAGLLKSAFIDKIHLCPKCNAGFHNFRELCTKCGSSNLNSQGLIHHYVCAHVAPERDYKKGNILICPKCNRELRHIGVDYDRPSIIFECNDCGEVFQDPDISVLCFNCKSKNAAEDLVAMDVKRYTITRYGIGIVKASLFHEEYSESRFPGCYSYNTFRDLLGQEVHRTKILKSHAICGSFLINIENKDDLAVETIDNIFMAASRVLVSSSASVCLFEDMFAFILPYTNYDDAKKNIEDLAKEAESIVKDSFESADLSIKTKIIDIKIDDTDDELLNKLIIDS